MCKTEVTSNTCWVFESSSAKFGLQADHIYSNWGNPVLSPNLENCASFQKPKDQYIIGAANGDNHSAQKEDLDYDPVSPALLNILRHLCYPRLFTQDVHSMWQNLTVNRCKAGEKDLICFFQKQEVPQFE